MMEWEMFNWNGRNSFRSVIFISVLFIFSTVLSAQNVEGQLFSGIRVSQSHKYWRFSGEYQIRLNNNLRSLDNHFLEFTAPYMPTKNWEIVPDFRATMYPDKFEFRPGIGVLYKSSWGEKIYIKQLVNQLKWQTDIESTGIIKHGLRYALFYSQVLSKKLMFSSGIGVLYRWSDNFNGIQFIRMIAGFVYIFDSKFSLTLTPYLGLEDPLQSLYYTPGFILVANIRLKGDSKYLAARYVTF